MRNRISASLLALAAVAIAETPAATALAQAEGVIDQARARERFDDAKGRFDRFLKSAKKRQELAEETKDPNALRRLCNAFQRDLSLARENLEKMDSLEEDAFDELGGTEGDHEQLETLANEGCPKGSGYQVTSKLGLEAQRRIGALVNQIRAAGDDSVTRDVRIVDLKGERDRLKALINTESDPTAKRDFQRLLENTEAAIEQAEFVSPMGIDPVTGQLTTLGTAKSRAPKLTNPGALAKRRELDEIVTKVREAGDDDIARNARILDLRIFRDTLKTHIDLSAEPLKSELRQVLGDAEAALEQVEFDRRTGDVGAAPARSDGVLGSERAFAMEDGAGARQARASNLSFSVGGHYTWADVPTHFAGTQFDAGMGGEVPIAESEDRLQGWGVDGSFRWRKSDRLAFFLNASYDAFDGSSFASVPAGGNPVATTYIFPNPDGGSTGLLAGPSGQDVLILTEADLIDFVAGLDFGHEVDWEWFLAEDDDLELEKEKAIGFHYRRFDRDDVISQQNLTFADVNSTTTLWSGQDFFGAQFSGALTRKPADGSGPYFGGRAAVSVGVVRTEWSAEQISNCGPCGAMSTEFNVQLFAEAEETKFAWIGGVSAFAGYQFCESARVEINGSFERMSKSPDFDVPTTPAEQPIGFGYDDMWTVRAGGRFTYTF